MKYVGIAMLFGLCTLIGMRLAAKKTARLNTVRSLRKDLVLFSERIATGGGTLAKIAAGQNGMLFTLLGRYLSALSDGESELNAAACAADMLKKDSTEQAGIRMFFSGLASASRADLIKRVNTLSPMLERAEGEAETETKQARVLRISGALVGAGLTILLL